MGILLLEWGYAIPARMEERGHRHFGAPVSSIAVVQTEGR